MGLQNQSPEVSYAKAYLENKTEKAQLESQNAASIAVPDFSVVRMYLTCVASVSPTDFAMHLFPQTKNLSHSYIYIFFPPPGLSGKRTMLEKTIFLGSLPL